jgi:hypothetical protein
MGTQQSRFYSPRQAPQSYSRGTACIGESGIWAIQHFVKQLNNNKIYIPKSKKCNEKGVELKSICFTCLPRISRAIIKEVVKECCPLVFLFTYTSYRKSLEKSSSLERASKTS